MTLLEQMECPTSTCYCGSACFCSLLPFVNLLEEEEREEAKERLLSMVVLDGTYFLSKGEERARLLPRCREGYLWAIALTERLRKRARSAAAKRQLLSDERFLRHLLSLVEEG